MKSAHASNDNLVHASGSNSNNQGTTRQKVQGPSVRAVYAFVSWIASISVYVIFLIWIFTPEELLHALGITYYPDKHYAINLPVYTLIGYIFFTIVYMSWNMINTPDPDSIVTLKCIKGSTPRASNSYIKCGLKEGIPDLGDLDPSIVSYLIATSGSTSNTSGI